MTLLRSVPIGMRLGAGMAAILVLMTALLAYALWGGLSSLDTVGRKVEATTEAADQVAATQRALLHLQVLVRNVGLQSEVDAVNAAEAAARQAQKDYHALRDRLQALDLGPQGADRLARLARIDAESDKLFDEAVGQAQQFNTEQAAAILGGQLDTLTRQSEALLVEVASLQRAEALAAKGDAIAQARRDAGVVGAVAAAAFVLSAAIAWSIARSIAVPLRQAVDVASRVARGDLAARARDGGRDEPAQLLAALDRMAESLGGVVERVRTNSEGIASGSAQIASGNADLSQRTELQASALQQTTATMMKLAETVSHNADSAREADALAKNAAQIAAEGGTVFAEMTQTMRGISESSRRIADIIGKIDAIAFQTNILALNAAVEAARAGEQGRGFAVVAAEVRTLAQSSAAAAREIKTLITDSVARVEQGNALVERVNATVGDIDRSIERVVSMIGEISSASVVQRDGVAEVGQALQSMDETTQQNAALVEQSAAAAESLRRQTADLVESVAVFRLHAG